MPAMTPGLTIELLWPSVLRRYIGASAALHLIWEIAQQPLYTIWSAPLSSRALAVLHCTIGDLMIASLSLLAALAIVDRPDWPRTGLRSVWLLLFVIGAGYTVYSEWFNVNVRGSWAYGPLMPTLPLLGTGFTPLLQWLVVPSLTLRIAARHSPWRTT